MTTYVHRTMIVPEPHAALARFLAESLAGPPGSGMWTTGLSPDGAGEATHYVSAGMVEDVLAALLRDADALHGACLQAGLDVALSDVQALVAASDVTDEEPFVAFARLGVHLISEEEP